jgi:AAHS family 4-hydroxybenzoate transporter-like MFS transporter
MTTTPASRINIGELLDGSRVGPLQIRVFALCMISLIMDGFDVQAMGYVGPAVRAEMDISPAQFGALLGMANFGVLFGSLGLSVVADKLGRRPVLIGATMLFAVLTLATAFARTYQELLWLRFIGGIGMGCIIPNCTALVGEFSPKRSRVTLTMCITVGFTIGAALGGFVARWLIPAYGWRSVFIFGGAVPMVIAVVMFWALPESLQFLAVQRRRLDQLARWLKQLDPTLRIDSSTEFITREKAKGGMPFVQLFREGRAAATTLLWVVNFTNLVNLYFLAGWLTSMLATMGYDQGTAVLIGTTLQVGGTIGTFALAWLIGRWGFIPILSMTFAVAAASIGFIGMPGLSATMLTVSVFIAGWCVVGGQPGVNTLAATYYPTSLRTTGIGWGLGIGRIGAILGPYIGGTLLGLEWTTQQLFIAAAIPAVVTAVAMFSLSFVMKLPQDAAPAAATGH